MVWGLGLWGLYRDYMGDTGVIYGLNRDAGAIV